VSIPELNPKALKTDFYSFLMAVNAQAGNNRAPVFLRPYKNPNDGDSALVNLKLWQAARTTSAPAYFKPLQVDGYTFVDGGLGANNPLGWYLSPGSNCPRSQTLTIAQALDRSPRRLRSCACNGLLPKHWHGHGRE
jgi:patatin-like phospholipase/acyl hydrolase